MPYARLKLSKLRDVHSASREDGKVLAWDAEHGWHVYTAITRESLGAAAAGHTHDQSDINGLSDALGNKADASALTSHMGNTSNPHSVTKSQVGLGNVSNDAQLKISSNLSDLDNAATARSNLGIPAFATSSTASAIPQANGSGKIDPAWVEMLSGMTPGTSAAGKAVTADANNRVGIGVSPDADARLTSTSIKATGSMTAAAAYITGGLSVGDTNTPIAGGLLFARAGSNEPFIRFACDSGSTGIAQIRGLVAGGLRVTAYDGNTTLMQISTGGNVTLTGNTLRITTSRTPASASATGSAGEICWDASYLYVCTATNTWKRMALSSW